MSFAEAANEPNMDESSKGKLISGQSGGGLLRKPSPPYSQVFEPIFRKQRSLQASCLPLEPCQSLKALEQDMSVDDVFFSPSPDHPVLYISLPADHELHQPDNNPSATLPTSPISEYPPHGPRRTKRMIADSHPRPLSPPLRPHLG